MGDELRHHVLKLQRRDGATDFAIHRAGVLAEQQDRLATLLIEASIDVSTCSTCCFDSSAKFMSVEASARWHPQPR
jgi:hypothetical protein